MNKQLAVLILTIGVCVGAVLLVPHGDTVAAPQQAQIEKACPQGTAVLPFTQTINAATGKLRQSLCVDQGGNVTVNAETLQQGGAGVAQLPINLAGGAGVVTGTLPGSNMAVVNLAASGNGGVTGVLPVANEGSGTPAGGKYVDGATGAWTALPAGAVSEATLTWPFNIAAGGSICTGGAATPQCVFYFFANAHTVTRVWADSSSAESGCTTFAQFGIRDITGGTLVASVTLGAAGITDSGALSVATIAGHQFAIGQVVADAGCTTHATVMSLTVTYQ